MKNYYEMLEISENSSQEELKAQYRFLVQAWHPDKFSSPEQKEKAENKTKEINKAYEVLGNPDKKREYDLKHNISRSDAAPSRPDASRTETGPPIKASRPASYSGPVCEVCGQSAELKHTKLYENIGMIVMRKARVVEGKLCKNCINYFFWTLTGRAMVLGWWGVISFFTNILILINNLFRYIASLGMTKPRENRTEDPSPIWILTAVGGYVLIGYFLFSMFSPVSAQNSSYSPSSSNSSSSRPTSTPRPHATSTSSSSNQGSNCYHWSQISKNMEGRKVCVYGNVYSISQSGSTSTRIEFSSKPNTFFVYSVNYIFPDLRGGDCIAADAVVQVWDGQIPFMALEDMYHCEPWMED